MKVLIIAPPILKDQNDKESWLNIPALGYGGIENVVYALINGLIHFGWDVTLIGVPGSNSINGLNIIRDIRGIKDISSWVKNNHKNFDIVHDHSCGLVLRKDEYVSFKYIATHHKTGQTPYVKNTVYLSNAQKKQAKVNEAPVVRLPIMFENYLFNDNKEDYYLYMGRISEFKGVHEAAIICREFGAKLIVAGPNWEKNYFDNLVTKYYNTVEYVGEVFGLKKIDLLSKAKAVFLLSRFSEGPWGDIWCEPGATIVGEAAASGTPVISSTNGCLSEIVVTELGVQLNENEINHMGSSKLNLKLPESKTIYKYAYENWNHLLISQQYLSLYEKVISGFQW